MTGTDRVLADRFVVANASFWLDQVAGWLDDTEHAQRLADDLWANTVDIGPSLTVIVGRAATTLRATLSNSDLEVGQ